jgi:CDP-diglyceride synthetase
VRGSFFQRVMRAGARLIFWLAIVLAVVQLIDVVVALKTIQQMSQERQFGQVVPSVSIINVVPKLVGAFAWPVLLIALAMVIDRFDALIGREGPRG